MGNGGGDRTSRRRLWTAGAWTVVLAAAALAYLPALDVGWVFDDEWNIVNALSLHWTGFSWEAVRQLLEQTANSRRVVANLSIALNHLIGGLEPRGYHLTNVLIHLATGTALFWVGILYPGGDDRERPRGRVAAAALVAAALFLLHPLNTQAVTYVVQRMASLAAMFCLLSFGAYLRGRRSEARAAWGWYAASTMLWLLGVASKENAALLPLVVITWEVAFRRLTWSAVRGWWSRAPVLSRTAVVVGMVGGAYLVAALALRHLGLPTRWFEPLNFRDFNKVERLLTQTRVGILYLTLFLWPAPGRLNLDHDVVVSRGLLDPASTLPAMLFWIGAVVGALWVTRRKPLLGFPLLAYMELHLLEAGPLNLELMFEHRMYLPMTMLVLFLGAALSLLPRRRVGLALVASGVLAAVFGTATYARNALWGDPVAFYADIANKSPNKPRAHVFHANALLTDGRVLEAVEPAERAWNLDSTDHFVGLTLGAAYLEAGRWQEALAIYRGMAEQGPREFDVMLRLGRALARTGDSLAAFEHFMAAGARFGMAGAAFEAIPLIEEAVALRPDHSIAHSQLGNAYLLAGRTLGALDEYERAVTLDPANAEAVYNLALTLEQLGRLREAAEHYRRFVEIAPTEFARQVTQVRAKLQGMAAER